MLEDTGAREAGGAREARVSRARSRATLSRNARHSGRDGRFARYFALVSESQVKHSKYSISPPQPL